MFRFFYPTAYYKNIYDISFDMLKKNGIKGLVFDVDNTLSPYDEPEPPENIVCYIKKAIDEGFKICLLSNNSVKRVELYNEKLQVHSIARAFKPSRKGLRKAMSLLGTSNKETVIIGDQLFTDVLCGKRAGIYTILVEPCSERDEWSVKIKRGLEKIVLRSYKKRKNR